MGFILVNWHASKISGLLVPHRLNPDSPTSGVFYRLDAIHALAGGAPNDAITRDSEVVTEQLAQMVTQKLADIVAVKLPELIQEKFAQIAAPSRPAPTVSGRKRGRPPKTPPIMPRKRLGSG